MATAFEINRQQVLSGGKLPGVSNISVPVTGSLFEKNRQAILSQTPTATPTPTTTPPVQPSKPVAPANIFETAKNTISKTITSIFGEGEPVQNPLPNGYKVDLIGALEKKIPGGFEGAKKRIAETPIKEYLMPTASGPVPEAFRQYISTTFKEGAETVKALAKLSPVYGLIREAQGNRVKPGETVSDIATAGLGTLSTLYRTSVIAPVLGATFGSLKSSRQDTAKILKGDTITPGQTLSNAISSAFSGVNEQPGLGAVVTDNPVAQVIIDVGFMAVMISKPYVSRKLDTLKLKSSEMATVAETLGVKPSASMEEISNAYKHKIIDYKEVFAGRGTAEEIAQVNKLNNSYNILKKAGVWERKLAGLFGKVNVSDIKVNPKAIKETAGEFIKPGEYTPQEIRGKIIDTPLEKTYEGKAIIRASLVAEQEGKSIKISAPAEKLTLYNGANKQVTAVEKNYGNVLEVKTSQAELIKTLADEGNVQAKTLYDSMPDKNRVDYTIADPIIRNAYQEKYDAIKYENSNRPQVGTEYFDLKENKFYAVNEKTAKLYSMQNRAGKYIENQPKVPEVYVPGNGDNWKGAIEKEIGKDKLRATSESWFYGKAGQLEQRAKSLEARIRANPANKKLARELTNTVEQMKSSAMDYQEAGNQIATGKYKLPVLEKEAKVPQEKKEASPKALGRTETTQGVSKVVEKQAQTSITGDGQTIIDGGKLSPEEQSRITRKKIEEAQNEIIQKKKQGFIDGGALMGTPLGGQIPTPMEEFLAKPKDNKENLQTVKDALLFGDVEAARQLHKDLGIKRSLEEIQSEIVETQNKELEAIKKELGGTENLPEDSPVRVLAEIADKLGKHFNAPGAIWKITGQARTYETPEGLRITVGGDKASSLDKLFFTSDMEGFAKTIKVLAFKFDKTFSEINSKIEAGDIDGADYERFKKRFQAITEKRPAYAQRPGPIGEDGVGKGQTKPTGIKTNETVSGEKGPVKNYPEADTGGYSDAESVQKKLENIRAIEFPELLRMYKTINNKVPILKLLRSYLGVMRNNKAEADIVLSYEIFKNPKIAVRVFAHELGHLTDYFPTRDIARGNLLGRIGTLRKYMKNFLPEFPGGEGIITPEDKIRLKKEAKRLSEIPVKEEYEVTIGETKATPAEIIAIWNDTMAGEKMPELMEWIKRLGEREKIEVVKGAIKGVLPEWANFGILTKEKRFRDVIRSAPADIKAKYQELIREEVKKRRLFALDEIKTELRSLTQLWKPFNASLDPSYTKYRYSSKELYADAISVLFNDPTLLKEKAPAFFRGFFNYIDLKPNIKEAFFDIQNILNAGDDAVFQERYKDLEKNYKTAEETWLAQEIERKNNKVNVIGILNTLFNNKNAAILNKVKLAIKEGRSINDDVNPLYDLAGLNYMEGAVKNFVVDNFQEAVTKAGEVDNGWSDLGKILQLERAIFERGELANPGGYDPETAQWTLDRMREKMAPEDWKALQEAKSIFRKGMQALVSEAEKEGYYKPELIAQMKANPAYATFQVLDYLDQNVTSKIYQQKGTLKGVANPATTSLMKMVTTLRAMRYNKSKKVNLSFLKDIGELEKAKTKWNGKTQEAMEPRDKNKSLVMVVIDGKTEGFYVDKDVGLILNHQTEATLTQLSTVTRLVTQSRVYRPLFTSLNLGFQLFNFSKDFQRAWRNMPDKTIGEVFLSYPRLIKNYITSSPAAWRRATGKPDAIVKEMEQAEIFGLKLNDLYGTPDPGEEEVIRVLRKIGVVPGLEGRGKLRTLVKPIVKLLDGIEVVGNYIEALPKIAGYKALKKKLPEKQLAHYIRNYIGSPDFLTRGTATPITNNLFLFSNAAKEGIKSDLNMAFKSQTKGAWWFKLVLGTIIPKMIQAAIAAGIAGTAYKKMMDGASEYDKTNYDIIPLGLDEKGQTIYIRSPKDETGRFYGALTWKFMNLLKGGDKQSLITNLTDVFSLWSGQLPNLTPSITGASALITYLSGKNPYDGFRNRNIIPDTEFKAGFKYSFPIMLKWLANNQGASIVMPAYTPKGDMTTLEKVLNLPILANLLGRFVKVSDYGQQEIDTKIKAAVEQRSSEAKIKKDEAIDEAIKNGEPLDITKALGHPPASQEDLDRIKLMLKQMDIRKQEGKNTYVDNLIYAGTNEAKVEMLKRYRKELTAEEFSQILTIATIHKIISAEVVKNTFIE